MAETVQERQKRRWRHLVRHSERWRLRYLQTHSEKLRGRVTDLGNAMANVQGIGTGQPIG